MKNYNTIEQVLGELENDFNFDNSDWIPRVGTWCISALSQLNLLQYRTIVKKCDVKDRIVQYFCEFDFTKVRVFANGCEIPKIDYKRKRCGCMDERIKTSDSFRYIREILLPRPTGDSYNHSYSHHNAVDIDNRVEQFKTRSLVVSSPVEKDAGFVITGNGMIELNFDIDVVIIEVDEVATVYSETYNQNLPVVPNNANVVEALKWFCVWKYLSRGNKHQVYSLTGNQQTNPMFLWERAKNVARTSVAVRAFNKVDDAGSATNSFYNFTFDPRN